MGFNRGGRGGGNQRRGRGLFDTIFSRNNLGQFLVALVLLLVVWSLANPYAVPDLQRGPDCIRLSHPLQGNQRSLLQYTDDNQKLSIEVLITNSTIADFNTIPTGTELELKVVFRNESNGPIYFFFIPEQEAIVNESVVGDINRPDIVGLYFHIEPVSLNDNRQFNESNRIITLNSVLDDRYSNTFTNEDIYIIRGQRSCHVNVVISTERLSTLGITNGEFRLRALYKNTSSGINPPIIAPTATPISGLADIGGSQGVWSHEAMLTSPEIRFRIES